MKKWKQAVAAYCEKTFPIFTTDWEESHHIISWLSTRLHGDITQ